MKLSEIKNYLKTAENVSFKLPNETYVPEHFHVTEVGLITKNFIDCGGTVRQETKVNFQLWEANDFEHRLKPQKLLNIIELSEKVLNIGDEEIDVEYQSQTIGKYGLDYDGKDFILTNKMTDCLAQDQCGITPEKLKTKIGEWKEKTSCCSPNTNCC